MGGLTEIMGSKNRGDGVMTTAAHAEYKRATGESMIPDVPPPPPPPLREQASQIGDSTRSNSAQLEAALMKRGMTKEQAQAKMRENEKTTGVRYK